MRPLELEDGTRLSLRQAKKQGAYITYLIMPFDWREFINFAHGGWSSSKTTRTLTKALTYAKGLQGGCLIVRNLNLPKRHREWGLMDRWDIATLEIPPKPDWKPEQE